MGSPEYVIDGRRTTTLDGFYDEIERVMLEGEYWGRNLDAFDDILVGDFGPIPKGGFVIRWVHCDVARRTLGTFHRTHGRFGRLAPPGVPRPSLFDEIVEIIRDHGADGDMARSDITLILE